MTVYQFLSSFLHASSTIKDVVVYTKFGSRIKLRTPALENLIYMEELNETVEQFSINGHTLVIYCK